MISVLVCIICLRLLMFLMIIIMMIMMNENGHADCDEVKSGFDGMVVFRVG